MFKNISIKELFKDKSFVIHVAVLLLLLLAVVIVAVIYIKPGELRVPVRYSSYDEKNFAFDQWAYLLNFVGFSFVVTIVHFLVAMKLYYVKGREFANQFINLGILVHILSLVFFLAIFKVVSLSR